MRTSPVWKRALINSSPGERPVPALSPLCISNHQKSPHGIYLSLPQNAICVTCKSVSFHTPVSQCTSLALSPWLIRLMGFLTSTKLEEDFSTPFKQR